MVGVGGLGLLCAGGRGVCGALSDWWSLGEGGRVGPCRMDELGSPLGGGRVGRCRRGGGLAHRVGWGCFRVLTHCWGGTVAGRLRDPAWVCVVVACKFAWCEPAVLW